MTLITSKGWQQQTARNQPSNGRNTSRALLETKLIVVGFEFNKFLCFILFWIRISSSNESWLKALSASSILKKFIDKCSQSETKSGEAIVGILKPQCHSWDIYEAPIKVQPSWTEVVASPTALSGKWRVSLNDSMTLLQSQKDWSISPSQQHLFGLRVFED